MKQNRILYSECVRIYKIHESFIDSLHESGLIRIVSQDNNQFVECDDISELEQFIRWFYDMDINVEGIEALHHMLSRVKSLQEELHRLQEELRFYKSF